MTSYNDYNGSYTSDSRPRERNRSGTWARPEADGVARGDWSGFPQGSPASAPYGAQNPSYDPNAQQQPAPTFAPQQPGYFPPPQQSQAQPQDPYAAQYAVRAPLRPTASYAGSPPPPAQPPTEYSRSYSYQPPPVGLDPRDPRSQYNQYPPPPQQQQPQYQPQSYSPPASMMSSVGPYSDAYEDYGRDINAPAPGARLSERARRASSPAYRQSQYSDEFLAPEDAERERHRHGHKSRHNSHSERHDRDRESDREREKARSRRNSSSYEDDKRVTYGDTMSMVAKGIKQLVQGHK